MIDAASADFDFIRTLVGGGQHWHARLRRILHDDIIYAAFQQLLANIAP